VILTEYTITKEIIHCKLPFWEWEEAILASLKVRDQHKISVHVLKAGGIFQIAVIYMTFM
jgi:hypothetical protein